MDFPKYKEYTYENYSFELQDSKWKDYLSNHGFVVIKNVVSNDICNFYKQKLWKTINVLTDVNLNDENNKKYSKNYPTNLLGGMYNIGHTKTQWEARFRCKKIFEKIWDDKDLITSFDKFCYCPKERTYKMGKIFSWLHSDQSPLNPINSYQGLLCLTDNMKYKSGGFICIPKSNIIHKQICKENGDENTKNDWIKLTDNFKDKYVQSENVLKVKNKIGDFVIWDSKTLHSGMTPINKKDERYDRVCIYICMRPKKELNKKNQNRRFQVYKDKRSTTHNPVKFKLFEKNLGRFGINLNYDEIIKRLMDNKLMILDKTNNLI